MKQPEVQHQYNLLPTSWLIEEHPAAGSRHHHTDHLPILVWEINGICGKIILSKNHTVTEICAKGSLTKLFVLPYKLIKHSYSMPGVKIRGGEGKFQLNMENASQCHVSKEKERL